MRSRFIINVCTTVQVGCMLALAGIGLKRNSDCYKAEMKLINTNLELIRTRFDNDMKDIEIRRLKEELAALKNEGES